jgi:hypothetical protein
VNNCDNRGTYNKYGNSIILEAAKLKSILEQKEGNLIKLNENERKDFLQTIDNLEKEFSDLKNNIQGRSDYTTLSDDGDN